MLRTWRPIVIVAVALVTVACSTPAGGESPPVTPHPASAQIASPQPAATVAATPEPAPATKEQPLITVGDDVRRVDLLLPSALDDRPGEQLPLLVMLHGNGESPHQLLAVSGADVVAEREGILVALPPAHDRRWRAIQLGDQPTESPDVVYVTGLIEQMSGTYPVDPERVYVAGFSMGAVLAGRLACERADLVAAIALDAGTDWEGSCQPERPVSVLVMHGTGDSTFGIAGAEAFAEAWRELDACAGTPTEETRTGRAVIRSSTDCRDGTAVEFLAIEGEAHRWFGDPDAMETAWAFFTTNQRR